MKKAFLYLSLIGLLAACTDQKQKQFRAIKDMEQSEAMGTPEGLAKLAKLHKEYGMKYTDSLANNFLYAAALYYFHGNQQEESLPLLVEYNERDDSTEKARNVMINRAQIYASKGEFDKMDKVIDNAIAKHTPTPTQWQAIMQAYESKIAANKGVGGKDYEQLALSLTALNRHEEAVKVLLQGVENFQDYEKRPTLLYRAGFICWEYLNNTEQAKEHYNRFLAEYPEHELAKEVEQILNSGMLEMTDEQILEMLKSKQ